MAQDRNILNILPQLVSKGLFNESVSAMDIFDLDYFENRIRELQSAFFEDFITHTLALKANPIRGVVLFAKNLGLGVETASLCETLHALSMEVEPSKIVFDSPCKTKSDLEQAMKQRVHINLDNEHEMEMIEELLKRNSCLDSKSNIGLRINPVVGKDKMVSEAAKLAFTASKASKFGLPILPETKETVKKYFQKYDWLSGVHFHIGSQSAPLALFVEGARICMDFVHELEQLGVKIQTIDIGGGLSSSYESPEEPAEFSFQAYKKALVSEVPELFSGKYQLITEFGRCLLLKAGTTLSKVQYVKQWIENIPPIVICHVGANQFYTEVYLPHLRQHRMSLADKNGEKKLGPCQKVDVAGPLCFQGDYMAKGIPLAESIEAGDILIIYDTGAYTMSMYSKFNSNISNPVYGFSVKSQKIFCFKERETLADTLVFWGSGQPRLI